MGNRAQVFAEPWAGSIRGRAAPWSGQVVSGYGTKKDTDTCLMMLRHLGSPRSGSQCPGQDRHSGSPPGWPFLPPARGPGTARVPNPQAVQAFQGDPMSPRAAQSWAPSIRNKF